MKTKKLSKKLRLDKKTIANLNNGEMRNAFGREIPATAITLCLPDCTLRTCDVPYICKG